MVGIAAGVFFRFGWISMLMLIAGYVLSIWLTHFGTYNVDLYKVNAVLYAIALLGYTGHDLLWTTLTILLSIALQ